MPAHRLFESIAGKLQPHVTPAREQLRERFCFFVDADTRINSKHVGGAIAALEEGCAGGGARIVVGGTIPVWAHHFRKSLLRAVFRINSAPARFFSQRARTSTRSVDSTKSSLSEKKFISVWRCESLGVSRFCVTRPPPPVANCECIRHAKFWGIF